MSLTAPAAGATVSGTVTLTATASDNVGVAGVQFLLDGTRAGRRGHQLALQRVVEHHHGRQRHPHADRASPRRRRQHHHLGDGERHRRQPGYHGTHGERHRSRHGATVSGTVTLTATAADNVGVAGVQFLVDSAALGAEDTTAPYSVSWNTTTAGPHTLTAQARDAAGNTTSASVTVTVELAASKTQITQIALGASPDFLGANGSRIYVLNTGDPTVSVIDNSTNTVIATSEPLPAGGAMVVSPDGNKLYVAEYLGTHIHVLDAQTLTLIGDADRRRHHLRWDSGVELQRQPTLRRLHDLLG